MHPTAHVGTGKGERGCAEQGEQGPMEMWGDASRFRRCDRRMPAYMSFQ